jgi:hypothetical protein
MEGGDEKCIHILSRNIKGRDRLVGIGIDGRTILKWILEKQGVSV